MSMAQMASTVTAKKYQGNVVLAINLTAKDVMLAVNYWSAIVLKVGMSCEWQSV